MSGNPQDPGTPDARGEGAARGVGREEGRHLPARGEERISPWEWLAGALGAIMIVAALALLVFEERRASTPPDVVVRFDSVSAARNVFVAHFTAENEGSSPASEIEIEGTLADGRDTITARATVPYLPGGSHRSGGLFFPVDPRTRTLQMRALGYEAP